MKEKESLFLRISNGLLIEAFGLFCLVYRVFVIKTVWNWFIPHLTGWDPVKFSTVFVIHTLLRYLVFGNMTNSIKVIKNLEYVRSGLKPTSYQVENWINFFESTIALVISLVVYKLGFL